LPKGNRNRASNKGEEGGGKVYNFSKELNYWNEKAFEKS